MPQQDSVPSVRIVFKNKVVSDLLISIRNLFFLTFAEFGNSWKVDDIKSSVPLQKKFDAKIEAHI